MPDTSVRYMGLKLSSPLVVASSDLVSSLDGIRRSLEAGAGAIVTKSLFEEASKSSGESDSPAVDGHRGAESQVAALPSPSAKELLTLISAAKTKFELPVIASLNCHSLSAWAYYAQMAENAGADGLELNISISPELTTGFSRAIEDLYLTILDTVRKSVDVPIAVKIAPHFTSMTRTAFELSGSGAAALVLFNRARLMDIDIDRMTIVPGPELSASTETHASLRWVAILAGRVPTDLAASTGVHSGDIVVKHLLAGAAAVQLCSAIYRDGYKAITRMNAQLATWMERNEFDSVDRFQGRLSQAKSASPHTYEGLQFREKTLTEPAE